MTPRIDPATGQAHAIGFSQLFLDPVTGAELGRRTYGDLLQGWINFMPFIYKLHYALALDMPGVWALGVVALVWTLDCFVGFYLTLPMRRRPGGAAAKGEARSFWQRWKPAWKIKWRGSRFRIHFDLHRAGSLWLWAALLVFAWSSVYMNLWDTVYTWTMRAVSDYHPPWTELQVLPKPLENPRLGWREALTTGQRLMAEHAVREGFSVETPVGLGFDSEHGVYRFSVRSSRDIQDREGSTQVHFDADTGEMRLLLLPSGQHSGNTITNWLYALHMANVFGLPWRIFVCVLGLAIVMLSITGVIIWLRKRRAARHQREHRVHTPAARTPFVNELVGSNRRLG